MNTGPVPGEYTKAMTDIEKATAFLREAAKYFEKRDTNGEDRAYWANVYNAKNCRDIADVLEALTAENARLKERFGPYGLVVVEFNGVGHYVSEAVAARITTLEAQVKIGDKTNAERNK